MVRAIGILAAVLMTCALGGLALAEDTPGPEWLAGAWVREDGDRWAEEWWTSERGGLMLGASRSGAGAKLGEFEHLRIVAEPNGRLVFQAQPGGKATVAFAEESRSAGTITFANPAHDYPQRISYKRERDTLIATISMMDGSRRVSWAYKRR